MKKITPFIFIFFAGFVISIASLTSNKKNPNIVCENFKTTELSIKDIVSSEMLDSSQFRRKAYNRSLRFNGKTYKKKVTYYVHDENGYVKSKLLPSKDNYTYEISNDTEQFIVDTFEKIDEYIDLDFERVYSPKKAKISIYKTIPSEKDFLGMATSEWRNRPYRYKVAIAWIDSNNKKPKLSNYPNLSYTDATTLVHEIAHALGLDHLEKENEYGEVINPRNMQINKKDTIMSYNNPPCILPDEDVFFTELDIQALRTLWGVEKDTTTGLILSVPENVFKKNAKYYFESANKKAEQGDHYGAISDYTKAIELDPKDSDAYYNRAISKDELKDYHGAISDNTKVIELDPNDVEAYLNRSLSKESLGDIKGACLDANKVVSLGDNDPDNKNWIKENC